MHTLAIQISFSLPLTLDLSLALLSPFLVLVLFCLSFPPPFFSLPASAFTLSNTLNPSLPFCFRLSLPCVLPCKPNSFTNTLPHPSLIPTTPRCGGWPGRRTQYHITDASASARRRHGRTAAALMPGCQYIQIGASTRQARVDQGDSV